MNYWVWCLWRSLLWQSSWKPVCRDPNKIAIGLRPGVRPGSISPIVEKENVWRKRDETHINSINKSDDVSEKFPWIHFSPQKSVLWQLEVRPCTINSDDPLLFGPSLLDEFQLCRDQYLHCKREGDRGRFFWTSNVGDCIRELWCLLILKFNVSFIRKGAKAETPASFSKSSYSLVMVNMKQRIHWSSRSHRRLPRLPGKQHHSKVEDVRRSTCSLCSLLVATNPILFLNDSEVLLILSVVITYDDMITKDYNHHDESFMNHDDMIFKIYTL